MQERYKNNIQKVGQPGPRLFADISTMSKTIKLPPLDITRDSGTLPEIIDATMSNNEMQRHSVPDNHDTSDMVRPIAAQDQTEKS